MKKITTMLALFGLALSVNAQEIQFELKDAYSAKMLQENSIENGLVVTHTPAAGKEYLIVVGTHMGIDGKTESVKSEEIYVKNGETKITNIGDIKLESGLFSSGSTSLYSRKTLNWVAYVFMVPTGADINTFMIRDIKVPLKTIGTSPKYKAISATHSIIEKALVDKVAVDEEYDWSNKEATQYKETFSVNKGKLLRLKVSSEIAELPAFEDNYYFSSEDFAIELENGIAIHAIGGDTEYDEFSKSLFLEIYHKLR